MKRAYVLAVERDVEVVGRLALVVARLAVQSRRIDRVEWRRSAAAAS